MGKQLRRPGRRGRVSAGNVSAAGYDDLNCESDGTDAGPSILIEHWNGRAWKYAENPGYSGGFFNAIVPLSARNIWAVGTAADPNSGDFTGTRIQHWDGTKWSDVTTPPAGLGAKLWGAAAVSANAIWAVGWSYTSRLTTRSLVERWNGRKWKVVPSAHISEGDALYGAAAIPGSDRLWAVGGLVERWNGRLWKIFGKQPPAHPLPKQGCKGSHTVTCTLVATGEHSFLVPKGVTSLHVVSVGGRGAPEAPGYGGLGARVTADLKVTGGEKLFVDVGGNGGLSKGGWNGGGAGGFGEHKCSFYSVPSCGGGGGGATAVQTCSSHSTSCVYTGIPSTDPRLLVAAGGGGAGGFPNLKASQGTSAGGSAGGTWGADGANGEEGGFGGERSNPIHGRCRRGAELGHRSPLISAPMAERDRSHWAEPAGLTLETPPVTTKEAGAAVEEPAEASSAAEAAAPDRITTMASSIFSSREAVAEPGPVMSTPR